MTDHRVVVHGESKVLLLGKGATEATSCGCGSMGQGNSSMHTGPNTGPWQPSREAIAGFEGKEHRARRPVEDGNDRRCSSRSQTAAAAKKSAAAGADRARGRDDAMDGLLSIEGNDGIGSCRCLQRGHQQG